MNSSEQSRIAASGKCSRGVRLQFVCTNCGAALETDDRHIGRLAICPTCETRRLICPPQVATDDDLGDGLRRTQIDIGQMLRGTWRTYRRQFVMCVLPVFLVSLISRFVLAAAISVAGLIFYLTTDITSLMGPAGDEIGQLVIRFLPFGTVALLIAMPVMVWLRVGQILIMVDVARGDRPELRRIFRGGPRLMPILVAGAMYFAITAGGALLLIVPGIVWSLMMSKAFYLIVDRRLGTFEGFRLSRRITHGNKIALALLWLIGQGMSTLASLLSFGLSRIFTEPFLALLSAQTYLGMSGQSMASDNA